jgi:hypothetical protein
MAIMKAVHQRVKKAILEGACSRAASRALAALIGLKMRFAFVRLSHKSGRLSSARETAFNPTEQTWSRGRIVDGNATLREERLERASDGSISV